MWWKREKDEIATFLYELLVAGAEKGYARTVAERMAVPYPTLAKFWLGKRRFPASLVKPLFHATDCDSRVATFFLLDGTELRLERTRAPDPPADLGRAVLLLGTLESRITDLYLQATTHDSADGERISAAEAEALRAAVQTLIAHADRLRAAWK